MSSAMQSIKLFRKPISSWLRHLPPVTEHRVYLMPTLIDCARHEVIRLKAISRKLCELKLAATKDETDLLQVLVSRMDQKLRQQRPGVHQPSGTIRVLRVQ